MQVAEDSQAQPLWLDERREERAAEAWRVARLRERIEALEAKNGLLQARFNDARDRTARLERQNRHLRETLLRLTSGGDD
jgi:chromosome segregation ATPase